MRAAGAAVNCIARIAGITSIIRIKINVRASDGQVPKHREIDSILSKALLTKPIDFATLRNEIDIRLERAA